MIDKENKGRRELGSSNNEADREKKLNQPESGDVRNQRSNYQQKSKDYPDETKDYKIKVFPNRLEDFRNDERYINQSDRENYSYNEGRRNVKREEESKHKNDGRTDENFNHCNTENYDRSDKQELNTNYRKYSIRREFDGDKNSYSQSMSRGRGRAKFNRDGEGQREFGYQRNAKEDYIDSDDHLLTKKTDLRNENKLNNRGATKNSSYRLEHPTSISSRQSFNQRDEAIVAKYNRSDNQSYTQQISDDDLHRENRNRRDDEHKQFSKSGNNRYQGNNYYNNDSNNHGNHYGVEKDQGRYQRQFVNSRYTDSQNDSDVRERNYSSGDSEYRVRYNPRYDDERYSGRYYEMEPAHQQPPTRYFREQISNKYGGEEYSADGKRLSLEIVNSTMLQNESKIDGGNSKAYSNKQMEDGVFTIQSIS